MCIRDRYEPPSVGPVCDTRPVSFAPPLGWGTGASPKNFFIASSSRDRLYEGFLNDEAYRLYSSRVREPGSSCARCWSLAIACAAARLSPCLLYTSDAADERSSVD